jgi:hypothetical protein
MRRKHNCGSKISSQKTKVNQISIYYKKKEENKKERQVLLRNTGATSEVGTAYHFRPPECVLCLITKDWGFHGSQQKYRKNNWHIVTDGCLVCIYVVLYDYMLKIFTRIYNATETL